MDPTRRTLISQIFAPIVLLTAIVWAGGFWTGEFSTGEAHAGGAVVSRDTYCVIGLGTGAVASWDVRLTATGTAFRSCSGTVSTALAATPAQIRDEVIQQVDGCEPAVSVTSVAAPISCSSVDATAAAFEVAVIAPYQLWLTAKVKGAIGAPTLIQVAPGTVYEFNPNIWVAPEPSASWLLVSGLVGLVGLARRRR